MSVTSTTAVESAALACGTSHRKRNQAHFPSTGVEVRRSYIYRCRGSCRAVEIVPLYAKCVEVLHSRPLLDYSCGRLGLFLRNETIARHQPAAGPPSYYLTGAFVQRPTALSSFRGCASRSSFFDTFYSPGELHPITDRGKAQADFRRGARKEALIVIVVKVARNCVTERYRSQAALLCAWWMVTDAFTMCGFPVGAWSYPL